MSRLWEGLRESEVKGGWAEPMLRLNTPDGLDEPVKPPSRAGMKAWLFLAGILGVVFIFGAIFFIWLYVQQVQNGYRVANLYDEYEQLITVQRKLRLEWSRFQDPHHLEELGRKEFGLTPPRPDQKVPLR